VEPHPILDDPDGHFPYKADAAREALATPPDPDTNNHPETWYTSDGIIDATDRYVQAQAIHFADPTDTTRAAMDAAAQALVATRWRWCSPCGATRVAPRSRSRSSCGCRSPRSAASSARTWRAELWPLPFRAGSPTT
jgi:hypothetical protein